MKWYGVVRCGMVWYGVVWCGIVWYGVVLCGMVWYDVLWCATVWYGLAITMPSGWGTTQAKCSGCCQQHGHEKQTRQNLTKQTKQTITGREKHKLDQTTPHNTHKLRASRVLCPAWLRSQHFKHDLLKTSMSLSFVNGS